jgi:outer membrane protein assembly factor BamB
VGPQNNRLRWSVTSGGANTTGAAIAADGTVYFGSNDHNVYSVDKNGKNLKMFASGSNVNTPTPAISASKVFMGSADHTLYGLNRTDLTEAWGTPIGADLVTSVALGRDGTIFFGGASTNQVFAIGPGDGGILWTFPIGSFSESVGIGDDGTVYAGGAAGTLVAITPDPDGGKAKWTYANDAGAGLGDVSIGDDGTIYGALGNSLVAVRPNGETKWLSSTLDGSFDGVAIGPSGRLYVGTTGATVYAVSPVDGKIVWSVPTMGNYIFRRGAVDAEETLYIGTQMKGLLAIDKDGKVKWTFPAGSIASYPAISDGVVYFGSDDGNFYAVGQ